MNDKKIEEMISEVIEYHDWGKLNPAWNFNGETTHADFSVQYYLKKKSEEKQDLGEYDCLVAYLILKHHGNLRVTTGFERYRELIESLGPEGKLRSWFFNTFDFKKRVELADAYGLFKIADCLSASSKSGYIPRKPDLNEANLNSFLNDPYRKAEQEDIKNIGRIGFLRAPTGWGKTSASPLYIINKDIKKVFFIFPTITAINSFHNKLSNLFDSDVGKYFYFYDVEIADERLEKSYVDWRIFESQHFLQPYMITSIDQVLLSFLQTGSYHMKRVMFRNTAVIIDEVHLLNDKMLFLLLHIFKKFIDVYNLNILFMSATFPDGLREAIREKMGIITNEKDFVDRISLCADLCRVKFEVRECMLAEEVAKVVEAGKKKKVLVICNTVESAVKIKREIEKYEGVCSLLLHGRFIYNTRREIEEKIEELATTPHILVATQVCEVSLDISYDVMFTELAPLPSLIQRFGRVN
ncbi:MAG: CRISPR-associated helicase Cas3', partial [Thermoplasmata archaeon]